MGETDFKVVLPMKNAEYWNLENAVAGLPPKAKRAFYAAAQKKTIKKATWDGCAFNAGGGILGQEVRSTAAAAAVFGCKEVTVNRFIRVWDTDFGSNAESTKRLITALEHVGLDTDPADKAPQIIVGIDTLVVDEFRRQLEAEEFIPGMEEAGALLFGSVA